jgi:hypothetical protein
MKLTTTGFDAAQIPARHIDDHVHYARAPG